jgi:hypothetical protein
MTEPDIERMTSFDPRRIRVVLPPRHKSGIDEVLDMVRQAFARAGCAGCASGLDIELRHDQVMVVDPETKVLIPNFESRELGGQFG